MAEPARATNRRRPKAGAAEPIAVCATRPPEAVFRVIDQLVETIVARERARRETQA